MEPVSAWFERKFAFTFPAGLYPNVIARLRGTPARAEELLLRLPRPTLTGKPDGKWSVQEHAGHLLDLEPLWTARIEDYLAGSTELTVADLGNRKTHEANHNAHTIQDLLLAFRAARKRLVSRVERIDAPVFSRAIPHPRLKQPMRLVDHLYFVAEHDDHHLAIIWHLISPLRE